MTDPLVKPRIGIAMSGASSRSVFYMGFLEVLQENDIVIDYIAASSGAAVIAAAYACGTLEQLKDYLFTTGKNSFLNLLQRSNSNGGVYSLDKVEEALRVYTKGQNFEDVRPLMGFVAVDLDKGEQVILAMGDIARAARISCTVPGVFEPVQWGSRTLVDGGLLSLIPADVVRSAGMEIVIGLDVIRSEYIFFPYQVRIKKVINFFKKILFVSYGEKVFEAMNKVIEETAVFDFFNAPVKDLDIIKSKNMFTVLGKAMDIAIQARRDPQKYNVYKQCDLLIKHSVKRGAKSYQSKQMKEAYEEGRQEALNHLPKIRALIENYQK
jgi:predicted acylesterase/phospholipase RssA